MTNSPCGPGTTTGSWLKTSQVTSLRWYAPPGVALVAWTTRLFCCQVPAEDPQRWTKAWHWRRAPKFKHANQPVTSAGACTGAARGAAGGRGAVRALCSDASPAVRRRRQTANKTIYIYIKRADSAVLGHLRRPHMIRAVGPLEDRPAPRRGVVPPVHPAVASATRRGLHVELLTPGGIEQQGTGSGCREATLR